MQKLQGIAVSPGIAIGEAVVRDQEGYRIPRRFVARDGVQAELSRLSGALTEADAEIAAQRDAISQQLGPQYAAIFEAHRQLLADPRLREELEETLRQRQYSAEYAVSRTLRRYAAVFQGLGGGGGLAERAVDLYDLEKRLLRHLLGHRQEQLDNLTAPVLVLAHTLTPSETARLNPCFVRGFVTETGGPGSHTAIVAEALEIPAVVGTGPFLSQVSGGDAVIIDGDAGVVVLQPDEETLARYRALLDRRRSQSAQLAGLRDLPAETPDGCRVELLGNIEFPAEVAHCLERGAEGVGLFRTEFLYLGAAEMPDEESQYAAYAEVVRNLQGRSLCIRTLDLGADKLAGAGHAEPEPNPFLGLRSIRLSLRNLPLFRTQLRAILRASALGPIRLMFPLVSTLLELRQAKMILADVQDDLREHGRPCGEKIAVGMMVETPAAVMLIDEFADECDFLSIGTNDLIQYTLAVDRGNQAVAALYNNSEPAVLRLIAKTVQAARSRNKPLSLCGQMSGSPTYTMLLLGLGLRQLSVPPAAIPEIKRVVRAVRLSDCERVAQRALALETAREVRNYLKDELHRVLPEGEP